MSTPEYPPPPEQHGWQPPSDGYGAPPPPPRTNGSAIAALVCGIIALLASVIPGINLLSLLLGIVAIITGVIGLRAAPQRGSRGVAIGGIVTGAIGLVVAVIVLVLAATFISDMFTDPEFREELERRLEEEGVTEFQFDPDDGN